jgi:Domain of unknown function (DUF4124)
MYLWRILTVLALFAAGACPAAVIYKWTDPTGLVHYTDQPVPGAHKITVDVDIVPAGPAAPARAPAPAPPAAQPYTQFEIDSPHAEQSFFGDPVPVHLSLDPPLQPGQALGWSLNGNPLGAHANRLGFSLPDLPRGAFTLTATIVDQATGAQLNTASVKFYVHRPSLLNPYHHPH